MDNLRAWAEVNLDNIAHNVKEIRKFVDSKVKIMAVVKAEGYGNGSVEPAKVMLENGADALGVATCDEGIKLRKSGITADIVVMAHSPKERFAEVLDNNLTQTVSSLSMAESLSKIASEKQKIAKIHIKVDTGMCRIGFKPIEENLEEILRIKNLPFINIDGVFSHLAMSESLDISFSQEQHGKFLSFTDGLKQKGLDNFTMHLCNSGGILNNPDMHLDMIRPGIILYGVYPSAETKRALDLKPTLSLKSRISHINTVEAGESVGYDRTFFADRTTKVATIIIGYADGYPSALSDKARVIVGGGYAPIIGQICMDQMMIDVTDIPDVKLGDEVILLGKKGGLEITAEEITGLVKIKIREVLCAAGNGQRIQKIYIKN